MLPSRDVMQKQLYPPYWSAVSAVVRLVPPSHLAGGRSLVAAALLSVSLCPVSSVQFAFGTLAVRHAGDV